MSRKRTPCSGCGALTCGKECRACWRTTHASKKSAPAPSSDNPVAVKMAKTAEANQQARRAMSDERSIDLLGQYRDLVTQGKAKFAHHRQFDIHGRFDRPSGGTVVEYCLSPAFAAPAVGFRLIARYDCRRGNWYATEFSWGLQKPMMPPGKPGETEEMQS